MSELADALGTHRAGIYRLLRPPPVAAAGPAPGATATTWARAWLSWPAGCSRPPGGRRARCCSPSPTSSPRRGADRARRGGRRRGTRCPLAAPRRHAHQLPRGAAPPRVDRRLGDRHPRRRSAASRRSEPRSREARGRGWARSTGELLPGASGVAAARTRTRRGERGVDRGPRRCGDGPRRHGHRPRPRRCALTDGAPGRQLPPGPAAAAQAGAETGASRSTWGLVASSARTFSRPASLSGARGSRA